MQRGARQGGADRLSLRVYCILADTDMLIRKPLRPLQILPLYPESCILYRAAKAALGPSAVK